MAYGNNIYIAAIHRHCIGRRSRHKRRLRPPPSYAGCGLLPSRNENSIVADMAASIASADHRSGKYPDDGLYRVVISTLKKPCGWVSSNEIYENQEALMAGALALAAEIADNATPAVQGAKRILLIWKNHGVDDGLQVCRRLEFRLSEHARNPEASRGRWRRREKKGLMEESISPIPHGRIRV